MTSTIFSLVRQGMESVSFAHVIDLPRGLTPGPTRGICWGIQGDGKGSLLLGRGKFKRLFQNQ